MEMFVYISISFWTLGCFCSLVIINNFSKNICVQLFTQTIFGGVSKKEIVYFVVWVMF